MKTPKAHPRVEAAIAVAKAKAMLCQPNRKLGRAPQEVKSMLSKVNSLLLPVGRHLCEGVEVRDADQGATRSHEVRFRHT